MYVCGLDNSVMGTSSYLLFYESLYFLFGYVLYKFTIYVTVSFHHQSLIIVSDNNIYYTSCNNIPMLPWFTLYNFFLLTLLSTRKDNFSLLLFISSNVSWKIIYVCFAAHYDLFISALRILVSAEI